MSAKSSNPSIEERTADDGGALEFAEEHIPPQASDQNALYALLDSLMASMGLDKIGFRANYDEIIRSILTQNVKVSTAASDLASEPAAWTAWSGAVKLFQFEVTQRDVLSEVERIKRNIKYPRALLALESGVDIREPNMMEFVTAVNGWTRDDHTIQWDQTHSVPRLWEPLLFSWSHSKNAVENHHNEASQRPLAGSIMQLLFYQSAKAPDERYEVLLGTELALPRPSKDYTPVPYCTKTDTIVVKQAPRQMQTAIDEGLISEGFAFKWVLASLYRLPLSKLQIGAFPLESKRLNGHSLDLQVAMDLSSIQHQRRILGLNDKYVFGATYAEGIFSLFASKWKGDHLIWMPVEPCSWDLKQPVRFIQCLYFLWAFKNHLDEGFRDDFDTLNVEKLRANIRQGPFWRFARD